MVDKYKIPTVKLTGDQRVDDGENRKALYARLQYALAGEKDPWQERAAGEAKHEFELLEV